MIAGVQKRRSGAAVGGFGRFFLVRSAAFRVPDGSGIGAERRKSAAAGRKPSVGADTTGADTGSPCTGFMIGSGVFFAPCQSPYRMPGAPRRRKTDGGAACR